MRPDNNWKEVRASAEDLSCLLNIPVRATEDFLTVLENLIVHKFVEVVSDEDCTGKDISIELPYLGNLVISIDENGQISLNFVARKVFYRKIKDAYNKRESPLVSQLEAILGDYLVKKMEDGDIVHERDKRPKNK